MSVTSLPRTTIQLVPANLVVTIEDRRDLLIGLIEPTGTATDGDRIKDAQALTDDELKVLIGPGELFNRAKNFVASNARHSPYDIIAVDPSGAPAAVAAESELTITGIATEDATLIISIVDERAFTLNIDVLTGDTAADVAAVIEASVSNLVDPPFSASSTLGVVTITALDEGTVGNFYGISFGVVPAGLAIALTAWAGGANDPDVTSIFDNVQSVRFTGISWPVWLEDQLTVVQDFLAPRFNANNAILDGVAFIGKSATFTDAKVAANAINDQNIVFMGNNVRTTASRSGPEILKPADWDAAYFMGVRSRRLTEDAPIADFLVGDIGDDGFGGISLASRPYFNTPLNRTPITDPAFLYSELEQEELEDEGFTTFGVNQASSGMLMASVVTTWTKDAAGNPNESFKFLNFVDTGSVSREFFFRNLKAKFAQYRLTQGDIIPGRPMANAQDIAAVIKGLYQDLAALGLTQAGSQAEAFFAANLTVSIDLAGRQASITGKLPIVSQLAKMVWTLQLAFSTE